MPTEDNGKFLRNAQIASFNMVSPWTRNLYDAERLWKISEEMVGKKYNF